MTLCAVVLQAFVPAGLMPQASSDGWLLKFCPDGIPTSVMVALFGHEHHHHHGADSQAYQQCDLGGGLVAEFVSTTHLTLSDPGSTLLFALPTTSAWHAQTARHYHTRAPPQLQQDQLRFS